MGAEGGCVISERTGMSAFVLDVTSGPECPDQWVSGAPILQDGGWGVEKNYIKKQHFKIVFTRVGWDRDRQGGCLLARG